MSDSIVDLRRKIRSAGDLKSVVRTMKSSAAASIGQYERSVVALSDYARTVELGLSACLRAGGHAAAGLQPRASPQSHGVSAIVFGSDQGLVGRFNEVVVDHALAALAVMPGKPRIWGVGARVHARLVDSGCSPEGLFLMPMSVLAITPFVGRMLVDVQTAREIPAGDSPAGGSLHLFYNRPEAGAGYAPVSQRLLPLDDLWQSRLALLPWPTASRPEVMGGPDETLRALIREFLFVSLFRACAESLASENASRLAAMERADQNIGELLGGLDASFHRLRQSGIDAELFDVIAGFDALEGDQ